MARKQEDDFDGASEGNGNGTTAYCATTAAAAAAMVVRRAQTEECITYLAGYV